MFSKNLQFHNFLYQDMSLAATGEAYIIVLPYTRNSAAVQITFSSAVYCFYIIISSV